MLPVAGPESFMDEIICLVDNRRVLLSCLEAFRGVFLLESSLLSLRKVLVIVFIPDYALSFAVNKCITYLAVNLWQ
jgi:hypothetical protein